MGLSDGTGRGRGPVGLRLYLDATRTLPVLRVPRPDAPNHLGCPVSLPRIEVQKPEPACAFERSRWRLDRPLNEDEATRSWINCNRMDSSCLLIHGRAIAKGVASREAGAWERIL